MSAPIIDLHEWFLTPAGTYLLDWERAQLDAAVADIFGYHALQLGVPQLDALRANRIAHQWLAMDHLPPEGVPMQRPLALMTDFTALPFPSSSLDLVVLPHTLEFSPDPHTTLREVERVLVPEGRLVVCGLNPTSLWGLRQRRGRLGQRLGFGSLYLPEGGEFIGYRRLRDWMRLLSLEVEQGHFGCYRPGLRTERWLQRFAWMDCVGPRWWPILGAAYFMVAVKRVRGMRLMEPGWKTAPARQRNAVGVANRLHD